MTQATPEEIQSWLEWAGGKLIAMPGARVGPGDYKVAWPAYSIELFQVLDFRARAGIRVSPPAKDEIPFVDEILQLPAICKLHLTRQILHARALIHPLTERHLNSWARIADRLRKDPRTIKTLHRNGLAEVVAKIDRAKVCRFRTLSLS